VNPYIGLIPKLGHLKVCSDIVFSSSEDVTCAIYGQSKRLSHEYLIEAILRFCC